MSKDQNCGKAIDPLLAELERLRESSRAAMTTFKAIEVRLAELERRIERSRRANSGSEERRAKP